jgi:hypothetical protein
MKFNLRLIGDGDNDMDDNYSEKSGDLESGLAHSQIVSPYEKQRRFSRKEECSHETESR